ncbi:flavin reductase [Sinimarinibacterium flocculans]|uniref:flavin reductase n=1 Tax=Sinimarinibacterium flocculans TaxID=985250 RepID=UPI0024927E4B|nr:flavin reductase [Sinimarinibacterium flocculans]
MTTSFDQRELRNVLGSFVTGVTVVTTLDADGQPLGVTANSFSSVSLEPPLILWSQALTARSFPAFRDAERFVINILAEDQAQVSQRFAKAGEDKFAGVATREGIGGLPLIDGCTAYLQCRKVATYPGGDHAVFIGQVEQIERCDRKPLAFGGGRYMLAHSYDLGTFSVDKPDGGLQHVEAVRIANAALPEIGQRLDAMLGLSVWGNRGPTVINWEPTRNAVTQDLHTGLVVSPVFSASGLTFTAYLPREMTRHNVQAELQQLREAAMSNVPSEEEIDRRLDDVRTHGLAHSVPERFGADIAAIGAPVFDHRGRIVFALTAVATTSRIGNGYDGPLQVSLRREAAALSQRLGHRTA